MRWRSRVTYVFRSSRLALRESSRDVRLAPWLDSLWCDLRFGHRLLRKDAVVSSAAVLSLGLAIGACTAAFSLVDALILRTLPVRDPESLVYVDRAGRPGDQRSTPTSSTCGKRRCHTWKPSA